MRNRIMIVLVVVALVILCTPKLSLGEILTGLAWGNALGATSLYEIDSTRGGLVAISEPASLTLLALGSLAVWRRR